MFLDEQEGIFLDAVNALKDCQSGNLWEHMLWAREEATNQYISELKNCMELNVRRALPQFSGTLGNEPFTKSEAILGTGWAGQAWALANKRGAKIKIKRIGTAFSHTGAITLLIKEDIHGPTLFTVNLNTTADTMNWNTVSGIEIPLSTVSKDCKYLYLIYQLPAGWLPKEMNASCGCGNTGIVNTWCNDWDACKPSFTAAQDGNQRYDWLKWMLITGIRTNDSVITSATKWSNDWNLKGLLFDVDITCETDSALCPESGLNFSADPLALVHAYAIRFKAAALLYSRLLSTSNISRFTTKNREYISDKQAEFNQEFQQRILYVCNQMVDRQNINRYNDCLACKEAFPIRKGQILK